MKPFISIIVPNYNHSIFLIERLESIFNQTYKDFEVILLDDSSSDNSIDILKNYAFHPKVSHFEVNETNSGSPFKQWDKGIEMAKGKYIWIAESDDDCDENFLSTLIECHKNNPEIALAYSQSYRVNSEGEIKGTWLDHTANLDPLQFKEDFVMDGNYFIEKFLIHKNVIPNVSGVLFKKKSLEKILPLKIEPYLKYNADWFYYLQILCDSKVAFVATPLNYFRFHSRSVIASAGSESGWLKIFKMELKGRKKMMKYLDRCSPENIESISKQAVIGNNKLKYLIAKEYIERGSVTRALSVVFSNPKLFLKIGFHLFKKPIKA